MAYTYIIKCSDETLYTGACVSIKSRMRDHCLKTGKCAKYTKGREVISIEAVWESDTLSFACKLESYIKKLKKLKKNDLINNPHKLGKVYGVHLSEIKYEYLNGVNLKELLDFDN